MTLAFTLIGRIIIMFSMMWALFALAGVEQSAKWTMQETVHRPLPIPPKLTYSPYRTAPIEVARIFGRSSGCAEASQEFITLVAHEAARAGINPRLLASTIVTESQCDQFAVSKRGAIGLMQIRPQVWKAKYDFEQYNLFNAHDNLRVGALILSDLINQYGEQNGVRRYQGLGVGCDSCDEHYVAKVIWRAK